jgi:uncharacterized membrane protein YkvA (DUF1232 family)
MPRPEETMAKAADQISFLQTIIDDVPRTAETVRAASQNPELPVAARRVCTGALNYLLDLLDIFPDHYAGLGLADDASVLYFAARHAVRLGAEDAALQRLADQTDAVAELYGELAGPYDKLVEQLADRSVRGRTGTQIVESKDLQAGFDADVRRAIGQLRPSPIPVGVGGPEAAVKELLRMTQHSLKKAGVV